MKKIIITAIILVSITFSANAQPGSTTGGFNDEPVDTPIDAGILMLVAAGAAYGAKKIIQQKNSKINK